MRPTELTLAWLRERGWHAAVVEKWVKFGGGGGVRRDLWGWMDVFWFGALVNVGGVQCCTTDAAAHAAKLRDNPELVMWLRAGHHAEIHSWRRVKMKRGGVAVRWELRRLVGRLEDGHVVFEEAKE